MSDMSPIIVPKSDQINADDAFSGPITIRIAGVTVRPGTEQPVSVHIEGEKKVFRPCKTVCRIMVAAWGPDSAGYVGKSMTLFRDPKVKWGGMEIGGLRVSHMSDISAPMTIALRESRANSKPVTVLPLRAEKTAAPGQQQRSATHTPPIPQSLPDGPDIGQDAPSELTGDLADYADRIDLEIDTATVAIDLHKWFNGQVKSDDWQALGQADPNRAAELKSKAIARVAELKESK